MKTKQSEYKGNKTLELYVDLQDKPLLTFGKRKAQAIVECYNEIKAFAEA